MRMVVVSQRVDCFSDRNETRDSIDQRLITFLLTVGVIPVPVPNQNSRETLKAWLAAVKPQGILLSGGNDIGQCIERDLTECLLLEHAERSQLPVLGICRGMQMLAHWSGSRLHSVQGHVNTRHYISGEITGEVNSFHNFSLLICPEDFEIMAKSEDGEIEAIRHKYLPWEGWMWHPEREMDFEARDLLRAKTLFNE